MSPKLRGRRSLYQKEARPRTFTLSTVAIQNIERGATDAGVTRSDFVTALAERHSPDVAKYLKGKADAEADQPDRTDAPDPVPDPDQP